jgi:hypothetical protein
VKKAFEAQNLNFVLLKGLPLHLYYENKHPRRIYADTDILVKRKDYSKIKKIFNKLGYTYKNPKETDIQTGLRHKITEFSFFKYFNGFMIDWDVHFEIKFTMSHLKVIEKLYSSEYISSMTNELFSEGKTVHIGGQQITILSKEHLFIYLLLHLFRHNFKGSYRYELLKNVLKKERLDYGKAELMVQKYKLGNFIYLPMLLLNKYYENPVPGFFVKKAGENVNQASVNTQLKKIDIFDDEHRVESGIERFRNMLFYSPVSLIEKVRIILNPTFNFALTKSFISKLRLVRNAGRKKFHE